ncbi:NAD dependent epimerase/dehydratase family enzyme [Leifsonia psychrotolerans]|uniref:NAD dependent epimerase/dehydratase family enzyme n=1 Tax=Glaciibacter psychrotolerans TaxID=670054 RepID=A0A7Z0EED1_9MICO|nr:NAD dependent epimerase/dehydratase family enzyme [Leifsonia psychrotolerans]
MSGSPVLSPYETAWGGLPDTLHPRLRRYFGAIPAGRHGFVTGVFERVGTPRRWLWPLLTLLGRPDVIFPGWHENVPFTVVNRPDASAVLAERTFHFPDGDRTMVDAITAEATSPKSGGLVDYLGSGRRLRASLRASVSQGALHLTSTGVGVRIGRRWLNLPPRLSFIGGYLARAYRAEGAEVSLIGRQGPDAGWGDTAGIATLLEGADLLVNLAGKSVNCRYTTANRVEILRSRVETTRELADAIQACTVPPRLWVNSSTATIYRHSEDRPMTETEGEIGTGFSVGIATAWEDAFFEVELSKTRRVALRMAIVLGDGSALVPLIRLAQFGLGGPQLDGAWFGTAAGRRAGTFHERRGGGGRQKFSWIHFDDVLGIIRHLSRMSGSTASSMPRPPIRATIAR